MSWRYYYGDSNSRVRSANEFSFDLHFLANRFLQCCERCAHVQVYIRGTMHKKFIMDVRCLAFVNGCSTVDSRLYIYHSATIILHVASLQRKSTMNDKEQDNRSDVLAVVLCWNPKIRLAHHVRTRGFASNVAHISSRKLSEMLNISRRSDQSCDHKRPLADLSKEYLQRSSKRKVRYSDSI